MDDYLINSYDYLLSCIEKNNIDEELETYLNHFIKYLYDNFSIDSSDDQNLIDIIEKYKKIKNVYNKEDYKNIETSSTNIFEINSILKYKYDKKIYEEFINNIELFFVKKCIENPKKEDIYGLFFAIITRHEFITFDEKKKYAHYDNNIWKFNDAESRCQIKIRNIMPKIFKKYKEIIVKDDNKLEKNYEECINNIQNNSFRKKIKDSAFDYLYVYDFKNKLNTFQNIIAFGNKILDVKKVDKEYPFRNGFPHDYLSIKSNLIIPDNISEELYEKCNDILNKIFPNEDVYEYFLIWCSSLLIPGNHDKMFHVWLGDGNNGKSAIATLLKYTFGEYCVTIPSTAFMKSKSKADAATPHLDIIKNALIVIAQEPDGGVMNVNFMKEMTGNDNIFIRALFQEGKNIQINAKFIMQANKRFIVDNDDFAAWNRFRVLLFQSYFIDKKNINDFIKNNKDKIIYNNDNEIINVFPIDKNLNKKLEEIAPAFLMLLIKKLPEYNKRGLPSAEVIMKITQEYRNKMDSFQIFIADNIVKIDENNEYQEIHQDFTYKNENNEKIKEKGISFEKILEIYNEHYKRKYYCNNKTVNIDKVSKTIKRQFESEIIKKDIIEREFIIGYTIKRKYNKIDDILNNLSI